MHPRLDKLPVLLCLLGLVTLSACTHPSRVAFARDFSCPVSEVRTKPLFMGAYQASGCGKTAGYHCPSVPPGVGCRRDESVVQRRQKKDRDIMLRQRFEADTGCAPRAAHLSRTARGSFSVSGCGQTRSYVCSADTCDPE